MSSTDGDYSDSDQDRSKKPGITTNSRVLPSWASSSVSNKTGKYSPYNWDSLGYPKTFVISFVRVSVRGWINLVSFMLILAVNLSENFKMTKMHQRLRKYWELNFKMKIYLWTELLEVCEDEQHLWKCISF